MSFGGATIRPTAIPNIQDTQIPSVSASQLGDDNLIPLPPATLTLLGAAGVPGGAEERGGRHPSRRSRLHGGGRSAWDPSGHGGCPGGCAGCAELGLSPGSEGPGPTTREAARATGAAESRVLERTLGGETRRTTCGSRAPAPKGLFLPPLPPNQPPAGR